MRLSGKIDKGWGHEFIWVTNDHYCSKFLYFNEGAKFSMHFHKEKIETWYVMAGKFIVNWINTHDATNHTISLSPGDVWHNNPLVPHQLYCEEAGVIIEVSTPDSIEDNFRIMPGDSQK